MFGIFSAFIGLMMAGVASVYSGGELTANGEITNSHAYTAASRTLPIGTMAQVTNRRNGLSVVVRINDRGPYVHGRVIDLMPAACRVIHCDGLAPVTVKVIGFDRSNSGYVHHHGSRYRDARHRYDDAYRHLGRSFRHHWRLHR
ncbi:MAG: septal ring lytic transglycosylase RlpA family protein [Nitrososphaerales archaeon]|jgi:rare lipoprotein A